MPSKRTKKNRGCKNNQQLKPAEKSHLSSSEDPTIDSISIKNTADHPSNLTLKEFKSNCVIKDNSVNLQEKSFVEKKCNAGVSDNAATSILKTNGTLSEIENSKLPYKEVTKCNDIINNPEIDLQLKLETSLDYINNIEKRDANYQEQTQFLMKNDVSSRTTNTCNTSTVTSTSEQKSITARENDTVGCEKLNTLDDTQNMNAMPTARKRGRPRKNTVLANSQQSKSVSSCQEQNILDNNERDLNTDRLEECSQFSIAENLSRRRSSVRNSSNVEDKKVPSEESDGEDLYLKKIVPKRRGRPLGSKTKRGRGRGRGQERGFVDDEYKPRTPGSGRGRGIPSKCTIINDLSQKKISMVKCVKCDKELPQGQWNTHNLTQHNYMSWREGDEALDFENDVKLLRSTLMAAIKRRKGQLTCEKCKAVKRSANGFISHLLFCGKDDEERNALLMTCPVCNRTMMPSSLEIHERTHRQLEEQRTIELRASEDLGNKKRKAAEKAVLRISQLTASVKEEDTPSTGNVRLNSPTLKSVIERPKLIKRVAGVLKNIWQKELSSKGTATCRQAGCNFSCSSIETICEHYSKCNFTPHPNFVCKICKFDTETESEMMNHVLEKHSMDNIMEKQSDSDSDNGTKYVTDESHDDEVTYKKQGTSKSLSSKLVTEKTSNYNRIEFVDKEEMQDPKWNKAYIPALHWTMEFELKNYELKLYSNLRPNPFILLNPKTAAKYLPKVEQSMATKNMQVKSHEGKRHKTNIEWKYWNKFEGGLDEGIPTFFVGGPVWALAWLPIPAPMFSHETNQYLAVSTHPTMKNEYSIGKAYVGNNIIQIWNLGNIDHNCEVSFSPKLAYAIVHDSGTVWCLEWCPSGCYESETLLNYKKEVNKSRRMGLLAAACSDGCVHIYSLPFPEELKFTKTDKYDWPIYKTEPVITLVVNILMYNNHKQNWQCTKLCWTKEHGHDTIVAGFSNGYVALWNPTATSPLIVQKRGNTIIIDAFKHFFAHGHAVSMVALVPHSGKRFLATAGLDKCYKFWDLENTSGPQNVSKKGVVVDGTWMTHWPCAIASYDDVFGLNHTNSNLIPLREYGYKIFSILPTNSVTYTIATCDYANSIAHGTLAGEILTIFPHQILHGKDMDKVLPKKRRLSSFIDVLDLQASQNNDAGKSKKGKKNSEEYQYMPDTYDGCKDRFGIVFCDISTISVRKGTQRKVLCSETLTAVPPDQYPFTSVNRICWNPNAWSYLWMGVGYQCGLVRILNFKSMSTANELKKLLSQHAESMLSKATAENISTETTISVEDTNCNNFIKAESIDS